MTEYNDVRTVSALYDEQAQIDRALDILDNYGGTVTQYSVAATTSGGEAMPPAGVLIATIDPGQSLIAGVRSSLVQRYNVINQELRDLGITGTPPNQAGGPPAAETQPA